MTVFYMIKSTNFILFWAYKWSERKKYDDIGNLSHTQGKWKPYMTITSHDEICQFNLILSI